MALVETLRYAFGSCRHRSLPLDTFVSDTHAWLTGERPLTWRDKGRQNRNRW